MFLCLKFDRKKRKRKISLNQYINVKFVFLHPDLLLTKKIPLDS